MNHQDIAEATKLLHANTQKSSLKKVVYLAAGTVVVCVAGYFANKYLGLTVADVAPTEE